MITVRKANKVLRIDENNKENYLARGYDVVTKKAKSWSITPERSRPPNMWRRLRRSSG